jgi:hypothetical protein
MHGWPLFRGRRVLDLFRRRNDIHELDAAEKLTPKQKLDIFAPKTITVFPNLYDAWITDESKPNSLQLTSIF